LAIIVTGSSVTRSRKLLSGVIRLKGFEAAWVSQHSLYALRGSFSESFGSTDGDPTAQIARLTIELARITAFLKHHYLAHFAETWRQLPR
jgi:hypothetical protein